MIKKIRFFQIGNSFKPFDRKDKTGFKNFQAGKK
jgi:hypothetical protein